MQFCPGQSFQNVSWLLAKENVCGKKINLGAMWGWGDVHILLLFSFFSRHFCTAVQRLPKQNLLLSVFLPEFSSNFLALVAVGAILKMGNLVYPFGIVNVHF